MFQGLKLGVLLLTFKTAERSPEGAKKIIDTVWDLLNIQPHQWRMKFAMLDSVQKQRMMESIKLEINRFRPHWQELAKADPVLAQLVQEELNRQFKSVFGEYHIPI